MNQNMHFQRELFDHVVYWAPPSIPPADFTNRQEDYRRACLDRKVGTARIDKDPKGKSPQELGTGATGLGRSEASGSAPAL